MTDDNSSIVTAVMRWQATPWLHPLTCDSQGHRPLVAVEESGHVVLRCPDCDYVQTQIPDIVLRANLKKPTTWN